VNSNPFVHIRVHTSEQMCIRYMSVKSLIGTTYQDVQLISCRTCWIIPED
jgi:hypothetical protein